MSILFALPTAAERAAIWRLYARQLDDSEVAAVAAASAGMSGRNIRDVAADAERKHAVQRVQANMAAAIATSTVECTASASGGGGGVGGVDIGGSLPRLPPLSGYLDAINMRRASSLHDDGDA